MENFTEIYNEIGGEDGVEKDFPASTPPHKYLYSREYINK